MHKNNNLKLSLDLSSSDSEFKKPLKKVVESPKVKIKNEDSDADEDFSIEMSGRKNKAMINKKERNSSISSESSTEIVFKKHQSRSSIKKKKDTPEILQTSSRSRSSSRGKSRSSSRPDSIKKRVSFTRTDSSSSSSSNKSHSSSSSSSSSGSETPTSEKKNHDKTLKRKSREKRKNKKSNSPPIKTEVKQKKLQKPKKNERSRSNSPTVSSLTSSLDETNISLPMKVYIDQKPPIDKTNLKLKQHRRSPSLEKPSDNEFVNNKEKKEKKKDKLIVDDNSSGAEMTDVSPLPSPYQPKVSMTPKTETPTPDNEKLKLMKFNEIFDMRELMRSIDDKIEKYTKSNSHRSHTHQQSNENLSAKSDKRSTNMLRFLSNSQLLDSESEIFNIRSTNESRNETSSTMRKKKKSKEKLLIEKQPILRVTSSALNRMKEQQRIEKENRVNKNLK